MGYTRHDDDDWDDTLKLNKSFIPMDIFLVLLIKFKFHPYFASFIINNDLGLSFSKLPFPSPNFSCQTLKIVSIAIQIVTTRLTVDRVNRVLMGITSQENSNLNYKTCANESSSKT